MMILCKNNTEFQNSEHTFFEFEQITFKEVPTSYNLLQNKFTKRSVSGPQRVLGQKEDLVGI